MADYTLSQKATKYITVVVVVLHISYVLTLTLANLFSNKFIFEIINSFAPYLLLVYLVGLFFTLLALTFSIYYKFISNLMVSFLLILIVLNLYFLAPIVRFGYSLPQPKVEITAESQRLKVAFYNKYFSNTNFSEINSEIATLNPDILGMGELRTQYIEELTVLKNYPYQFTENCVCKFPQDVALFSKYPISKAKTYSIGEARIVEAFIEINGAPVQTFVIHTTAPENQRFLNIRNEELAFIPYYINESENGAILMGDFNSSPWTKPFIKFTNYLGDKYNLVNASQNNGLKFTWSKSGLFTHLDHIFIPEKWQIIRTETGGSYGSDHRLIYTEVIVN